MFLAGVAFAGAPRITDADTQRAAGIVAGMTLEEKCCLISGQVDNFHTYPIERLGVKSVLLADATMGVRQLGKKTPTNSTCFPCGMALASTFNKDLAHEMGRGVGLDCRSRGVGILLGPGVNIYRYALCGRNFEYLGEDPYLSGEIAAAYVCGLQTEGVIATVKHFALNNQEYDRHMTASYADERTLNEIYYPAFKRVVQEGVGAVMASYNPVNGTHASDNAPLLQKLRDWGFDGIIMSDWTSTYSTLGCLSAPLDIEFPGAQCFTPEKIIPLVEKGLVSEKTIDLKCIHILQTLSAFGLLDNETKDAGIPLDNPENHARALEVAREGIVMLKNNGILPLKPSKKGYILLCGPNADKFVEGGGSSIVFPYPGRVTTMAEGLKSLGKGYEIVCRQYPTPEEYANAKAVIFALGFDQNTELEKVDRKYNPFYRRDPQERNLQLAVASSDKVVVVVNAGGEIDLSNWGDKAAAILYAWYPGEAGGQALAEVISGKVSPSGRLPFTFWGSLDKNPVHPFYYPVVHSPRMEATRFPLVEYNEGVFVGYRGIDDQHRPLYPFGHGLTYSSFEYSGMKLSCRDDGTVELSFTVRNVGKEKASEVAQVYVSPKNPSVPRPERELKAFCKLPLKPGESKDVNIILPSDAFAHYDLDSHAWLVDNGKYEIQVGASSMDIRLNCEIEK